MLVLTFVSVLYGHSLKKKDLSESENFLDMLLMGRKLTLPLFVATLVSTWYGGIFGVTKIAFNQGIYNFVTQGLFWYVAYFIFAFFLVHRIRKHNSLSLPDLLRETIGTKAEKISAVFNLINVTPVAYIISLGLFLQLFTTWSLFTNMFVGLAMVLFYSSFGGFRAVVYSDLIQFFVMCISVALILYFSVSTFGGLEFLTNKLPATHFDPMGGEALMTTFVWGFIALSTLVDPVFYQRCFAAQSTKTAKNGIVVSIIIWFLFDMCTTFGAMYARALIPTADPGNAYLVYAIQLLPEGLRGFMLAGILAIILSTLDSYLFLGATTLNTDLIKFKTKRVFWHYMSLLFVATLGLVLAHFFEGNIKNVWKTLGSYSAACLLLPVIVSQIWPRLINQKVFLWMVTLGVIGTTMWRVIDKEMLCKQNSFCHNLDDLYFGIIFSLFGLLLSRVFKAKSSI